MGAENKVFLHCCQWTRKAALDTTNAYSEGFMTRLIPTFDNVEEEADKASQAYWEAAMSSSAYERDYYDEGDFAEAAEDAGIQVYENLNFVKQQLMGLSIAGLYHLWERTLKQFIAKELNQYGIDKKDSKGLQRTNFEGLVELLQQFNHDVTVEPYYDKLNEMRLVANAVKHGAGDSLNELVEAAPHLFDKSLSQFRASLTADDLALSLNDFKQYSGAVVEFWMRLPQRMNMLDSTPQA